MKVERRADVGGRLVRRYKRFFADVEVAPGDVRTVHCPNPGSMRGVLREGAAVRCSTSDDPKRKLRHTLELVRVGRVWVGVHAALANRFAERVLERGVCSPLAGYTEIRREVALDSGSRLDFRLDGRPNDPRPCWVEVKSVTLADGTLARFPDSPTVRGRKHALELAELAEGGARAVLLFVVQRGDCDAVEPADDIDPDYGAALREATDRGVEVLAIRARATPTGLHYEGSLPVKR